MMEEHHCHCGGNCHGKAKEKEVETAPHNHIHEDKHDHDHELTMPEGSIELNQAFSIAGLAGEQDADKLMDVVEELDFIEASYADIDEAALFIAADREILISDLSDLVEGLGFKISEY